MVQTTLQYYTVGHCAAEVDLSLVFKTKDGQGQHIAQTRDNYAERCRSLLQCAGLVLL